MNRWDDDTGVRDNSIRTTAGIEFAEIPQIYSFEFEEEENSRNKERKCDYSNCNINRIDSSSPSSFIIDRFWWQTLRTHTHTKGRKKKQSQTAQARGLAGLRHKFKNVHLPYLGPRIQRRMAQTHTHALGEVNPLAHSPRVKATVAQ